MSQEQQQQAQKAQVALITGCSTGIGMETAALLAAKGYKVYATMRDVKKADSLLKKCEELKTKVELMALDVSKQQSIDDCIKTILEKEGHIDVLVNNAGYGHALVLEHSSMAQVREVFEVNFFGLAAVCKAVLPTMRKHKSGRIVNISSIGGLVSQPFNEIYCAAKFAVEGLTEGMATTVSELGIHCSLIEPGPVATEFVTRVLGDLKQSESPDDEYKPIFADYIKQSMARRATSANQTGADIAQIILTCLQAEKPHLRYLTSDYVTKLASTKICDLTGDNIVALCKQVTLNRPPKQQ